jgi:dolichol-phosphate mannosyltransferase
MIFSIIIPVYNEEKTIKKILDSVYALRLQSIEKEIIVVDDCSTDSTGSEINSFLQTGQKIKVIKHAKNKGKGSAILSGIKIATGDYIIIQDSDLEYSPKEIPKLLTPILQGRGQVVYGTRLKRLPNFRRDERTMRFFIHYIGNKFLSLMTSLLYRQWITDLETGYKIFPRHVINRLSLSSKGFEFEAEVTAKLLKKGYKIIEVPISTNPRGYNQGKKLQTVRDGLSALLTLVKYKFII